MESTRSAASADEIARRTGAVTTFTATNALGVSTAEVAAHVRAGRWRRIGRAVVTHTGPLGLADRRAIALANSGPRALLTAFSGLECLGLKGWHRDEIHVLIPAGTDVRRVPEVPVTWHRVARWAGTRRLREDRWHAPADAAVVAACSLTRERSAIGLLAAVTQQQIADVAKMRDIVARTSNLRHRRALLFALDDMAMGAQALSEIDFGNLCRRAGLAGPDRQAVRVQPDGRRRYLDAEWKRPDGRRVAVEVDGALHQRSDRWWDDQARQNEVALTGALVLRYPAPVVRAGDALVADQLRRAGVPRRQQ